ncbi:hypothetical protein FQA47_005192 [Oryzias melastigma]|uniref:Uncharacterized protein n=1 Tax=Oryzias melastigma TaxID=30732 RepID=A0A834C6F1_ORYME|nr:hypothetical protein FQA47_005192 [Oryzias melastigma]
MENLLHEIHLHCDKVEMEKSHDSKHLLKLLESDQEETQHQGTQISIFDIEKKNEEIVQQLETLQDKLLSLQLKIQQQEAPLQTTPAASPQELIIPEQIDEIKSEIISLRQEQEVLLEEQREIENSKSQTQALLEEYHQEIRIVESLKTTNYDLKWELMELHANIFDLQQISIKLQAAREERQKERREESALTQGVSQARSILQRDFTRLMKAMGISLNNQQGDPIDQIQALQQQNADLQKELEDLKNKRHEEDAAMRIDLSKLQAEKSDLEDQCELIREVILKDEELHYPEQIRDMKSQIVSLRQEMEVLQEEQREMEKSKSETKALLKEFSQVKSNVEDLKKENYDLKQELEELNLDLLKQQDIQTKMEAAKTKRESLRKEKSVLIEQISECRSKIHQTAALNKPKSPTGNSQSLIPRPVSAEKPGPTTQVSTDAGKTQHQTVLLKRSRSPPDNSPSLRPSSSPSKQVSEDFGRSQKPTVVLHKPQPPPALKLPPLSPKRHSVKDLVPARQTFTDIGTTQQLRADDNEPQSPGVKLPPLSPKRRSGLGPAGQTSIDTGTTQQLTADRPQSPGVKLPPLSPKRWSGLGPARQTSTDTGTTQQLTADRPQSPGVKLPPLPPKPPSLEKTGPQSSFRRSFRVSSSEI